MTIYIYGLKDPQTQKVRYIGRTRSLKTRMKGHLSKAKRKITHRDCWISSLMEKDLKPEMILLETLEDMSWSISYAVERSWISFMISTGHNLTNHHDRGEGGKDRVISKKQRAKISKKVKMLHKQGLLTCNRKPVDIYDLNANFVKTAKSYIDCAAFIGVSKKHMQAYFKRGDVKIKSYIVVPKGADAPAPYQYVKRDNKSKKRFLLCKNDEQIIMSSKAETNLFFELPAQSTRLNYYMSIGKPFAGWCITVMPD